MLRKTVFLWGILVLAGAIAPAFPVVAQGFILGSTSQLRTLDQDRLFSDSAFGQRVEQDLLAASRELAAENQRILTELTEEERALTDRRAELSPEAFRDLADAFDERVVAIRAEQEQKAREVTRMREQEQTRFFETALPVLVELMRETGVVAVLDSRAVILSSETIDFTDQAIARIDRVLGDGIEDAPDMPVNVSPDEPAGDPEPDHNGSPEGPPLDLPVTDSNDE